MGRGTGRRGSFCDPFAAEAVKASRRPNRRLIQGGEGWLRGRSVLWHNRQYNACCQKPLSRDFENHRPASEGAWLVSIGLFGSCHKATQRSRQVKGLYAAGRPSLYLLMPAGRSGALGPKVSYGHTLSFGSRGTDGEGFHAHAAELGFSPEDCDPSNLLEVFYQSKAHRSHALLRILKRHLRQVKDGAFCYRCKGDFPAFR